MPAEVGLSVHSTPPNPIRQRAAGERSPVAMSG
jgi:hypothetical protein